MSYRIAPLQYFQTQQTIYTPTGAPCRMVELLCIINTLIKIDISFWCSLSYKGAPLQYKHTQQTSDTPTGAHCIEELLCSTTIHNRVDILLLMLLIVLKNSS